MKRRLAKELHEAGSDAEPPPESPRLTIGIAMQRGLWTPHSAEVINNQDEEGKKVDVEQT
jgi:hypothetical protein